MYDETSEDDGCGGGGGGGSVSYIQAVVHEDEGIQPILAGRSVGLQTLPTQLVEAAVSATSPARAKQTHGRPGRHDLTWSRPTNRTARTRHANDTAKDRPDQDKHEVFALH